MNALLLLAIIFAPVVYLSIQPKKTYTKRNKKYWSNVKTYRTKPLKITYWNA